MGAGPGRRKPVAPQDVTHAIMGQTIQAVWEDFYNHKLWSRSFKKAETLPRLLDIMTEHKLNSMLQNLRPDSFVRLLSHEEMLKVCKQGVIGTVSTFQHHELWRIPMRVEIDLEARVYGVKVGGRADFVVEPKEGGILLDGKNTTNKESVHPDQLRWYGLLYRAKYGEYPNKLGFVYYRYPYDPLTEETGISWVSLHSNEVESLADKIREVHLRMVGRDFVATPSPAACRWCKYKEVCPDKHLTPSEKLALEPPPKGEVFGLDGIEVKGGDYEGTNATDI